MGWLAHSETRFGVDSNALNLVYREDGWTPPGFDYLKLRGEQPSAPYVACVGGGHVFGRDVERPWPSLLDVPTLNLGLGDASPATFHDGRLLDLINQSTLALVAIPTARNQGRDWQPNSDGLKGSYMKDGGTYNQRWRKLLDGCPGRLRNAVGGARREWRRDLDKLLALIQVPVKLLWVSKRWPAYRQEWRSLHGVYGHYPHLVNKEMLPAHVERVRVNWPDYYPDQAAHEAIAERVRKTALGNT